MSNRPVTAISAEQLARQLSAEQPPQLLDCRELDEWTGCRIEGAVHIPMHEVFLRVSELDADRPVVVYCHHGMRSQMVAEFLARRGFAQVANLTGGIDAWSCHVDPSVPRY